DFVVDIFRRAGQRGWPAGEARAFNLGTGRGLTNGEVASIVAEALAAAGYRLRIEPTLPLEPGEAGHGVLDVAETERVFDGGVPTAEAVHDTIAAAVRAALEAEGR